MNYVVVIKHGINFFYVKPRFIFLIRKLFPLIFFIWVWVCLKHNVAVVSGAHCSDWTSFYIMLCSPPVSLPSVTVQWHWLCFLCCACTVSLTVPVIPMIYLLHNQRQSRFIVASGWGVGPDLEEIGELLLRRFIFGVVKMFWNRWWWWLYNAVYTPRTIELYDLSRWIKLVLCLTSQ